jgi:proline iminopeptidase
MYMKSLTPLEKDFTVIYLNTRGAGRSDGPAKSSGFVFALFVADLETLRVHLQLDRWLFFAHSDAALQALEYAIKYPKVCRGLFIVDGAINLDDKESNADRNARMKKLSHRPWYAAAMKAQRKIDNPNISDENFKYTFLGDLFPLYFASYEAAVKARHYFSASTYRVKHNKYDDYAPNFETKQFTKIQVPTAVFEGDGDVITTPLDALRLERSLPNSTLFMIRNAGHFPWLEQREIFFKNFAQAANEIVGRQ